MSSADEASGQQAKVPTPDLARLGDARPEFVEAVRIPDLWWRIHRTSGAHPAAWNQFRHWGPVLRGGRFDPHPLPPAHSTEGVLYAGDTFATAVAEAFWSDRAVDTETGHPWVSAFVTSRALRLLDLSGNWAVHIGAAASLNSAPYPRSQQWARGLREHFPEADGVAYSSSVNGGLCAALWLPAVDALPDGPDFASPLGSREPEFSDTLSAVASMLGYAQPGT